MGEEEQTTNQMKIRLLQSNRKNVVRDTRLVVGH